MLEQLLKGLGQALVDQMAQAEYRNFIGSLFQGSEQTAIARLRERVRSVDDAGFDGLLRTVRAMIAEAQQHLQQVQASGGNDAWGGSFEDRMALMMAQLKTGDYSVSHNAIQQAQLQLGGLRRVEELAQQFRAEIAVPPAATAAPAIEQVEAMLDELAQTGKMPDGLLDAIQALDADGMERAFARLKAMGADVAGDRPLDNIRDYYVPGDGLYTLYWPLAANLPLPFDELDRATQFHVLFAECKRRLAEGGALRNAGRLDEADAAFRECLERADQIDVPILKSDAYQGLMTVAERRGDRAAAGRYLDLAQRENARQTQRR
jgi:hypothetical protein